MPYLLLFLILLLNTTSIYEHPSICVLSQTYFWVCTYLIYISSIKKSKVLLTGISRRTTLSCCSSLKQNRLINLNYEHHLLWCFFYVELSYIFAFGMLKIKAKVTHNVFESMFSTIFLEIERLASYGLYTLYTDI